jgi:hypothetical protein
MESGDCGLLGDTRPPNEGRSLRLDALVLLELEFIFADVALVVVLGARLRAGDPLSGRWYRGRRRPQRALAVPADRFDRCVVVAVCALDGLLEPAQRCEEVRAEEPAQRLGGVVVVRAPADGSVCLLQGTTGRERYRSAAMTTRART